MNRKLSAGNTIETRCSRCDRVLNHSIVAMIGEKIVRVECSTCLTTHAYHPVKTSTSGTGQKKVTTPRKSKADPASEARAEWASLQPGMDAAQAIPYDMNRPYRANNLLFHPNFGLGLVQLVIPPNKIDVLFQDGKKLLRCG